MRLVPVDQRDPIRGDANVARVGVAVDHAGPTSDEPRPRRPASSNALRRHRAKVDPSPCFGVQEVGRRSPTWALRPGLRQTMQPAERIGHPTPVGLRLGRSPLDVCHHHQTVGEQPSVRRRNRQWRRQTLTVEVLKELGLPSEICVTPSTQTTDREAAVDAHAPDFVGDSASERFDASCVVTPPPERFPSHWRHRRPPVSASWGRRRPGRAEHTSIAARLQAGMALCGNLPRPDLSRLGRSIALRVAGRHCWSLGSNRARRTLHCRWWG